MNADVAFYFGIDGQGRVADNGPARPGLGDEAQRPHLLGCRRDRSDASERRDGARVLASARGASIDSLGGYYGFGVCQDEVAAIELKMTGKATQFPNTADGSFFTDPKDAEVNALIRRLPKDRMDGCRRWSGFLGRCRWVTQMRSCGRFRSPAWVRSWLRCTMLGPRQAASHGWAAGVAGNLPAGVDRVRADRRNDLAAAAQGCCDGSGLGNAGEPWVFLWLIVAGSGATMVEM